MKSSNFHFKRCREFSS